MNKHLITISVVLLLQTANGQLENYRNNVQYDGLAREIIRTQTLLDSAALDSFFINMMDQQNIPGLATCIVRGGEVIQNGSYGYANIEENIYCQQFRGVMSERNLPGQVGALKVLRQ